MKEEERLRQIEQVEEEIACLGGLMKGMTGIYSLNPSITAAFRRIEIAEQERLSALRTGMKPEENEA